VARIERSEIRRSRLRAEPLFRPTSLKNGQYWPRPNFFGQLLNPRAPSAD
jgi:hypothetical protein